MLYKNIYFTICDTTKDVGNFREYLINNTENLVIFYYPPSFLHKASYIEVYEKSLLTKTEELYWYTGKNTLLKYMFLYIYHLYTLLKYVKRKSFVLTIHPLFCFFSSLFTFFQGHKYILWLWDYFPDRSGVMKIYHGIVDYYNQTLDYVIYLGPPLYEIYAKQAPSKKVRRMVTFGIKNAPIEKKFPAIPEHITLGFMAMIRNQQGIELSFELLQKNPHIYLEVIGGGYLLEYYKNMAKELGIDKQIIFYGPKDTVIDIIKKWDIGIALYEDIPENISRYCEPSKIKVYFSYNLPVITTKTTYIHEEIAQLKAGEVIDYNVDSLERAVQKMTQNYQVYIEGVSKLNKKYEYTAHYNALFDFLKD